MNDMQAGWLSPDQVWVEISTGAITVDATTARSPVWILARFTADSRNTKLRHRTKNDRPRLYVRSSKYAGVESKVTASTAARNLFGRGEAGEEGVDALVKDPLVSE